MQTPEDILDGAVIYIGWIFASIPFIFCTTWSPASCAPWATANAAVLPDPDQRSEHRPGSFVHRARSRWESSAQRWPPIFPRPSPAWSASASCAASLRCCIAERRARLQQARLHPPDGHRRADGPAVQHHGHRQRYHAVGRQRAGQHGCRRRHRRQQDDEPADRPAGERRHGHVITRARTWVPPGWTACAKAGVTSALLIATAPALLRLLSCILPM